MDMLATCSQQRLLGTHPPGQRALYDLYNAYIAARVHPSGHMDGGLNDKPVIVGLALKQKPSESSGGDVSDDDDFVGLADDQRERFQGILDLVSKVRA